MESSIVKPQKQTQLTSPNLPLAVYREVEAHLRQISGVNASLIMRSIEHDPQEKFDYYQSQVAAIQISYDENSEANAQQKVEEILHYYGNKYSPWEIKSSQRKK